ncbi:MAG: Sua5/YciO/YrdC/YwlC family protein [Gemmatimonadota bacterium]
MSVGGDPRPRAVVPYGTEAERRVAAATVRAHLVGGGLLAYPTETVYGLGGLLSDEGLTSLAALKARPRDKPFLLLLRDRSEAGALSWTPAAELLADSFWPGPLTLILDDPEGAFPAGARADDGGVAIRVSPHPAVRDLLEVAGGPLTSTSANRPGERPARSVEDLSWLAESRAGELLVLDAGRLPEAHPSTIVDCRGRPRLIRPGAIEEGRIRSALADIDGDYDARAGSGRDEERAGTTFNLLFVCTGNTCRSPMAEGVTRALLAERGWGPVAVTSAGVAAAVGAPASAGALRVAAGQGIDLADHRARQLSRERVHWADLILAMGPAHVEAVHHLGGGDRVDLLTSFASEGAEERAIQDPFGGSDAAYEETYLTLRRAIENALERLAPILAP